MAGSDNKVNVTITGDDVRRLGFKLVALQHALTTEERAILWGALAVAVDALSSSGAGPGEAPSVTGVPGAGQPVVKVDRSLTDSVLDTDIPDMLADAFHAEKQVEGVASRSRTRSAQQDPLGRDARARKIGGLVGGIDVPTGRRGR